MLIVESRPHQFRDELNRSHFLFAHRLAAHALFEVPRLLTLCESVNPKQVAIYQAGADSPRTRPREFTGEWNPAALIAALREGTTRLRLSGVQAYDEEYRLL